MRGVSLSKKKKVSEPSGGGSGQERAREAVGQEVGKIRQHNFDVYRALVFDAVSPIVGGTESFREDHRGAEDDGEAHAHQTSAYVVQGQANVRPVFPIHSAYIERS